MVNKGKKVKSKAMREKKLPVKLYGKGIHVKVSLRDFLNYAESKDKKGAKVAGSDLIKMFWGLVKSAKAEE